MHGIPAVSSTYGTPYTPLDQEILDDAPQPKIVPPSRAVNAQPSLTLTERLVQWGSRVWNGVPRQPVQPVKGFDVLPDEVIGMIGKLNTNPALIRTSHKVHDIVQDEFREKLNEACLKDPQNVGKKPSVLFANPANRLSQHVPSDRAGLKYLKVTYGIWEDRHQFLINQIKAGLPLVVAERTVRDNRLLVQTFWLTLQSRSETHPWLAEDMENGLVTLDNLRKMLADPKQKYAGFYSNEQIRNYLKKGELRVEDMLDPRCRPGLKFLRDYPDIEPYLDKECVRKILCIDEETSMTLQSFCVRHPEAVRSFLAAKFSR